MEPVYGKWPWPRSLHGEVVEYLQSEGAAAVGFDIIFSDRSLRQEMDSGVIGELKALAKNADIPEIRDRLYYVLDSLRPESSDAHFVSAVKGFGNVFQASVFFVGEDDPAELRAGEDMVLRNRAVLSASAVPAELKRSRNLFFNVTVPFPDLALASKGIGHINFHPDSDGTCRRTHPLLWLMEPRIAYPSMPLLIAADIKKVPLESVTAKNNSVILGDATIPLLPDGSMMINYQGGRVFRDVEGKERYESFYKYIPYDSVIASKDFLLAGQDPVLARGTFKDKIVLVTASAVGLSDLRSTPFSPVTPAIEIHANVIDNILSNRFLRPIDGIARKPYVFLLALFVGMIASLYNPYIGFAATVALTGSAIGLHWTLFGRGWVLPVVDVSFAMIGTYLGVVLRKYVSEEREKRHVKTAFGHYLAPQVLEDVLKSPDKLRLGGERKHMTVLFSDIEGFTSLSEKMAPEEISAVLNEYFGRMLECIKATGGTLDKFIGDAVMAEWNAPLPQDDHAARACETALLMMRDLEALRKKWPAEGKPLLRARIGINTGEMVVGNLGSKEIFEYTVIGAAVNTSARLEPLNKDFGTSIIVSESTRNEAENRWPGRFVFRRLARVELKGRAVPLDVYELAGWPDSISEGLAGAINTFHEGLGLFLKARFSEAGVLFGQLLEKYPQDGPSRKYLSLCEHYKNNPPAPGWEGVYTQTSK